MLSSGTLFTVAMLLATSVTSYTVSIQQVAHKSHSNYVIFNNFKCATDANTPNTLGPGKYYDIMPLIPVVGGNWDFVAPLKGPASGSNCGSGFDVGLVGAEGSEPRWRHVSSCLAP